MVRNKNRDLWPALIFPHILLVGKTKTRENEYSAQAQNNHVHPEVDMILDADQKQCSRLDKGVSVTLKKDHSLCLATYITAEIERI